MEIAKWEQFIEKFKDKELLEKLLMVNSFINENVKWVSDAKLWRKKDYWATPYETLKLNAGDCEDIAILKYYTLLEMGLSDKDMLITYTKYNKKEAHMILSYFIKDNATIILDNIDGKLTLSKNRPDLKSVYGFNRNEFVILKEFSKGKSLGSPSRIKLWEDLRERTSEILT